MKLIYQQITRYSTDSKNSKFMDSISSKDMKEEYNNFLEKILLPLEKKQLKLEKQAKHFPYKNLELAKNYDIMVNFK